MVGLKTNSFLLIICFTSAVISIGVPAVPGDSTTTDKSAKNKTTVCKGGMTACGSRCYNSTAGESCDGGVICKKNEKRCGSVCYDLTDQECLGNNIICKKGSELCGNNQCFHPIDEICHKVPVPCPKDTELCGVKCYLSEMQKCFPGGVLCKKELEKPCGNYCYSPITHSCIADNIISPKTPVIVTSETPSHRHVDDSNDTVVITAGSATNKGQYFSPYWPVYLLISMSVLVK